MKKLNLLLLFSLLFVAMNVVAQDDPATDKKLCERLSGTWDVFCSEGDNIWKFDSTGGFEERDLACETCISFVTNEFGKWVAHDDELHVTVLGRKTNNVIEIFDHQVTVHYRVEFDHNLVKLTPVFMKGESIDAIVDHHMYDILYLRLIE